MLFVIDKKTPPAAKEKLSLFGEIIEFETENLVDDYLSGHPDIFFFQNGSSLIYSPNVPEKFLVKLQSYNVKLIKGYSEVSPGYPGCAKYNAVLGGNTFIHNPEITDSAIKNGTGNYEKIEVKQGFTRCSLLYLNGKNFITSDKGIEKKLKAAGKNVFFEDPSGILLPGCKNGFIGGCAGISENKIFITGMLKSLPNCNELKTFISGSGFEIIELYEGPLFDGGGIFIF